MKIGQTNIELGTVVILNTPNDKLLNGLAGTVTYPFGCDCNTQGCIGIILDGTDAKKLPYNGKVNVKESEIIIIN